MSRQKRIAAVVFHVLAWIIFLSIPAVFNPRMHGTGIERFALDMMEPPRYINGVYLIFIFYFNHYFVIPQLYFRKRYMLLGGYILLSFAGFVLLNYALAPPEVMHSPFFTPLGNSFNLFMFIIVNVFSYALSIYAQWMKTREEQLNTRISFLTAQINPHFLFNVLNNIYSLSLSNSTQVPGAILKLSGIMRYSVSEGEQKYTALANEIEYIKNYVELQKLRLSESVHLDFFISGDANGQMIAPFLLIPFVENVFKHGVNTEEDCTISIRIDIQDTAVILQTQNSKLKRQASKQAGFGLGISNTRERLEMLYPGKHSLEIDNKHDTFMVTEKIYF